MPTVAFTTSDGVTIAGSLFIGPAGGPAALLLHMMPKTKESWAPLAEALVGAGFGSVLAIDLRGHGESLRQGDRRLDYKNFSDAEHQAKMLDVEAAVEWLMKERGARLDRAVIVGASIGANLAIRFAADHPEVPAVAALSPGLDYRGVTTADAVARLRPKQAFFLAAS
ncbi:alpha/beta fold hydrolase, partial [Candidatus Uhrbacteria bacterium]|nr:alpha/beta fold hydrolase [Candidatus Uhrbacteria bacterium]